MKRRVIAAWRGAVHARRESAREDAHRELQLRADNAAAEVERLQSKADALQKAKVAATTTHVEELSSLQDKCVTLGSRAAEAEAAVARLQAERDAMAAQLKRAEVLATSELESSAMVYKADADAATKQAAARVAAMQNEQRDLRSRVEQLEVKLQSATRQLEEEKQRHGEEASALRADVHKHKELLTESESSASQARTQLREEGEERDAEVASLREQMELFKSRLVEIMEKVQLEQVTREAESSAQVEALRRELAKVRTDAKETISVRDAELRLKEQAIDRLTSERDMALGAAHWEQESRVSSSAQREAQRARMRKAEDALTEQIQYLESRDVSRVEHVDNWETSQDSLLLG